MQQSNATTVLSATPLAGRPAKRLHSEITDTPVRSTRVAKRAKSENLKPEDRYLIAAATVIFTRGDLRPRDAYGELLLPNRHGRRANAPTSDMSQSDMVALYFNHIDRTVVSQSKGKGHTFAPPDWQQMESYLFPFLLANLGRHTAELDRVVIKHIAFRIHRILMLQKRVIWRYSREDLNSEPRKVNVEFGKLRGWWWESDGDLPPRYMDWTCRPTKTVPGNTLI